MISGNITATISDHQPQFLFTSNVFSKASYQKFNIYEVIGQSLFKQTL